MAKILLVEDDNNLREIYEARLQAEGYTIVSARDGEEALVVAKAEMPDLVISDVMMPKISGFEMLDILRNTDGLKDVKVIMLTALGQSDDQKRADKLGADRYLVKSQVTLEDIVKTAQDLLKGDAAPAPGTTVEAPTAPEPTATVTLPNPAPAAEPDTAKPAPSDKPPTDSVGQTSTESAHDKLMADAVDTLVANTDKPAGEEAPTAKVETAKETPTDEAAPKEPEPAAAEPAPQKSAEDDAPSKHQRIIKPLESEPQKDIQTLLAEEEAKEAGVSAPAGSEVVAPEDQAVEKAGADASSTADEEAAVDAKIEDFVAGATTEPSTPDQKPADEVKPTEPEAAKSAEAPAVPAQKKITVNDAVQPSPAPTPATTSLAPEAKDPADPNNIAL